MIEPTWSAGDVSLWRGDCLEVMPALDIQTIDGVITDPPYGIGINKSNRLSIERGFIDETWDDERVTDHIILLWSMFKCLPMVIWGGNYYSDCLPPSRGWLAWDKVNDGRDFGPAELPAGILTRQLWKAKQLGHTT